MISPTRFLAIDWSGAASAASQRRHIVAAEVDIAHIKSFNDTQGRKNVDMSHIFLHAQHTRTELIGWLCRNATTLLQSAVVGLDFSFSLPAGFLRQKGCNSATELWELVAHEGEEWLATSPEPFWGRPGKRRPMQSLVDALRQTERGISVHGIQPKSTFQTGGAGATGTGSLRGMPLLLQLREAGYSIWPFDPPHLPMVVEIYPRLLTGPVVKSSLAARSAYLNASRFVQLPEKIRQQAAGSEDAFDALVSALAMASHASSFCQLHQATDPVERLEGRIWTPAAQSLALLPIG